MELKELQQYKLNILLDIASICEKNGLTYFLFWGTLLGAVRHNGFIPWDDDIDIGLLWNDYNRLISILEREYSEQYFVQNYLTERNYPCLWTQLRVRGTTSMPQKLSTLDINWGISIDIFPVISVSDNDALRDKQCSAFKLARAMLAKESMQAQKNKARGKQAVINQFPNRLRHRVVNFILNKYAFESSKEEYTCGVGMSDIRRRFRYKDIAKVEKHLFEGHMLDIPSGYDAILTEMFDDYMTPPPPEKRIDHEMTLGTTIIDPSRDYRDYQSELRKSD